MKYYIEQQRTYTTWLVVEADNYDEAETKYLELVENGTAYDEELKQMNVGDEDYEIHQASEKEEEIS